MIFKQKLHKKISLCLEHSSKYEDKEPWLWSWPSKAGMTMHRDILKEQSTKVKPKNNTGHVDVESKWSLDNSLLCLRFVYV